MSLFQRKNFKKPKALQQTHLCDKFRIEIYLVEHRHLKFVPYTETHEGAGIHPRGTPWRIRAVVFSSVVLPDPSHCTSSHLEALILEQLPVMGGFLAALSPPWPVQMAVNQIRPPKKSCDWLKQSGDALNQ